MYEALDQWDYVIAAYVLSGAALGLLIGWSYRTMRQAEKRREESKRR